MSKAKAPDCLVGRMAYGDRPCEGPGTYYCDDEIWGSRCREVQARAREGRDTPAEALARRFHETYERLAPDYAYGTREEPAVPWNRVPVRNRRLMVAVAQEMLDAKAVEL